MCFQKASKARLLNSMHFSHSVGKLKSQNLQPPMQYMQSIGPNFTFYSEAWSESNLKSILASGLKVYIPILNKPLE